MKKFLVLLVFAAVVAALTLAGVNALRLRPSPKLAQGIPPIALDENAAAARLAAAVRIPTVSWSDRSKNDLAQFEALRGLLETSFPKAHAAMQREIVNGSSLVFTWPGKDASAAPLLLTAHQDVVPVEQGTEGKWKHPPFAGEIAEGYVWGRGALDDKGSLMALMEAAEVLAAQGFQPARTVLFAFGHDEEIGGKEGAAKIAEWLKGKNIRPWLALDEGGSITLGVIPGVTPPVASIMAAEKGYASFRLTARGEGGHASRPPKKTIIGSLSRAVSRLEEHQMPTRLVSPVTDMFDRLGSLMPIGPRVLIANRDALGFYLRRRLEEQPTTNTQVRTTTAPTIIQAGIKDNVLPSEGFAVINFRLLPGDTIAGVEQHIRETIADASIEIATEGQSNAEPSPVSDTTGPEFRLLERTVNEVFPEAVVASGLVAGATDLRNYAGVYASRFNFAPTLLTPEDLPTIHGTNERVAVPVYGSMIRFYVRLLQNLPA